MNINELVIYRNLKHEDLFEDMASLMGLGSSEKKADAFGCAGQLVELAVEYGFEGNLWHCFIALCLAIMKMPTPPPVRYGEMPAAHWICWQEMITVFSRHYLTLILKH